MTIQSHRDLKVWQQAMDLAEGVYRLTSMFPPSEAFSLNRQLRRAAVCVPSNIAEGYGRGSRRSYIQFLKTARGSLLEFETQVMLAVRVKLLDPESADQSLQSIDSISRMLSAMIRTLEQQSLQPKPAASAIAY